VIDIERRGPPPSGRPSTTRGVPRGSRDEKRQAFPKARRWGIRSRQSAGGPRSSESSRGRPGSRGGCPLRRVALVVFGRLLGVQGLLLPRRRRLVGVVAGNREGAARNVILAPASSMTPRGVGSRSASISFSDRQIREPAWTQRAKIVPGGRTGGSAALRRASLQRPRAPPTAHASSGMRSTAHSASSIRL